MKKTARPPKRRFDLLQEDRASSILARDINRDIILELLRLRQPIARVELAELSGMQRSTVSLIVEQLIEEKWVVEGAMVRTPRGRPPTMLSLNRDLAILVADVRPSQATLAVVDLNGHFILSGSSSFGERSEARRCQNRRRNVASSQPAQTRNL